jgi:hypothetical protein
MTFTDEQYKEMAAAYTNGETLAKLADVFGVSIPTMSKYVFKGGARIRPRGQRKGAKKTVELAQVNNVPSERTHCFPTFPDAVAVAPAFVATALPEIITPQAPVARRILPLE